MYDWMSREIKRLILDLRLKTVVGTNSKKYSSQMGFGLDGDEFIPWDPFLR